MGRAWMGRGSGVESVVVEREPVGWVDEEVVEEPLEEGFRVDGVAGG